MTAKITAVFLLMSSLVWPHGAHAQAIAQQDQELCRKRNGAAAFAACTRIIDIAEAKKHTIAPANRAGFFDIVAAVYFERALNGDGDVQSACNDMRRTVEYRELGDGPYSGTARKSATEFIQQFCRR